MGYYLEPSCMASMFGVPSAVADKYIKTAGADEIKVLLWSLRHPEACFSEEQIAEALRLNVADVRDALASWAEKGILHSLEASTAVVPAATQPADSKTEQKKKPTAVVTTLKPSREEATKRGLECPEIAFLLHETEKKLGKMLTSNEISTLVWLYDYQGLGAALILMIVGYAVSEGRPNIGFIERTAVEWVKDGVCDITTADERLVALKRRNSAWHTLETTFGIEHRAPSKAELDAADLWINEWQYDRSLVKLAYDACIDSTSKFSFPYIKKILTEWHKSGVKTADDVASLTPQGKKEKSGGYDDFLNSIIKKSEEG